MINMSFILVLSSMVITLVLFILSLWFTDSDMSESSETAFECGFEPIYTTRVPFSMHYFSITIVFLIFDLEVVLLLPVLFTISSLFELLVLLWIMFLLLLGLIVEWNDDSLSWQLH